MRSTRSKGYRKRRREIEEGERIERWKGDTEREREDVEETIRERLETHDSTRDSSPWDRRRESIRKRQKQYIFLTSKNAFSKIKK